MMLARTGFGLITATVALAGCATYGASDGMDRGKQATGSPALACRDRGMPTCLQTLGHKTRCFCSDEKSMRDLLERNPR
jgi:hypothetical protein